MSKKIIFILVLVLFFEIEVEVFSKENNADYKSILKGMLKIGMNEMGSYDRLKRLVKLGPRLDGSAQAAAAIEFVKQEMEEIGLDSIKLEAFTVPRWQRGESEEARVINSFTMGSVSLSLCALGGSVSTPKEGIIADVIEVKSIDELKSIAEKAKGKIIFFNRPMDNALVNTFQAYGETVDQRYEGAVEAAKYGATAVIIRSLTTSIDNYPHTGMLRYDENVPKIPAAAISTQSANLLSELLKREKTVKLYLKINSKILAPAISFNVIGEISGVEKPKEIILLGAHLDSWDLSEGAHDDGAGTSQVLQAMYLIKKLSIKPKRTIRAVLFMDEEFGCIGGKEYAISENRKNEKHIAAIESDTGGFAPLAFTINDKRVIEKLNPFFEIFEELQIFKIKEGRGGCDIAPLSKQGSVTIGLLTNPQRYFDLHHSAKDTIENIHPRELELGTISMAMMAIILSDLL